MAKVELLFKISALRALHVGTGLGLAGMVDKRTARRFHQHSAGGLHLVYIPGSTIKGRLRWHYTQLARQLWGDGTICPPDVHCRETPFCPVCTVFGSEAQEGQLYFQDAPLAEEWLKFAYTSEDGMWLNLARFFETEQRTNTALSRRRGVVKEQMLYSSEVAAPGLTYQVRVCGEVQGALSSVKVGDILLPGEIVILLLSAKAVSHLGGGKSRGLGRCTWTFDKLSIGGSELTEDEIFSAINDVDLRGWKNALSH